MWNNGLVQNWERSTTRLYHSDSLQTCKVPMDCSPLGSSVHGILQARILEWVAIPFSKGSSWPRYQTWASCITGRFFTVWVIREACICHSAYLTSMQVHHEQCWARWITIWNQDCWEKYQQPQICRLYHSNGRKWRGTKEPLDDGEREEETVSLILNTETTKTMASSPFTSWQMEREKAEVVSDFIFLGSKITSDGDYSHEIKRHLLFGRKAMTNLDSVVKSRNIALPTKVHRVKAMVFPVGMYGCEG